MMRQDIVAIWLVLVHCMLALCGMSHLLTRCPAANTKPCSNALQQTLHPLPIRISSIILHGLCRLHHQLVLWLHCKPDPVSKEAFLPFLTCLIHLLTCSPTL